MTEELIVGKNIGELPDPFPYLSNKKIPSIKSELNVNDEYIKMYELMEDSFSKMKEVKTGDVVSGTIVNVTNKEIEINIGYKDSVYADKPKVGIFTNELEVGDEIDVLVISVKNSPYLIKGSVTDLIKMKVHEKTKDYYKNKMPLIAKVKELIPAGYLLDIHMDNITVPAFMPNTLADVNRLSDPQSILGVTFEVMLETLQQEKGVYVVSRRKYLQTLIPSEIKKIKLGRMYNYTVFNGIVTGTTPFGVFVQFGVTPTSEKCLTGMVHKANISEGWEDKWDQIIPGMEIDFYVKEIIKNNKIILTQRLEETLWDSVEVDSILTGKIKDIKTFGVLITLEDDVIGLIQATYVNNYKKDLHVGDDIKVKVMSIVQEDRKIYLNFVD